MTRWVGDSGVGRPRGPVALVRAWTEVIARPRTFFRSSIAPGDQGPGLTFLATVVAIEEGIRIAVQAGGYPILGGQPILSAAAWLLFVVVIVAPLGTHLIAALQTILLAAGAPDRGGISETVQVLCYATAPCVIVGIHEPWLQSAGVVYSAVLYIIGTAIVHDLRPPKAAAVGALPALLVFGVGFRGVSAVSAVIAQAGDWVSTLL
ncbi:MAG: YIP1 family protein [Salinirussus sp.]